MFMKKCHIIWLAILAWGTARAEDHNSLYFTDAAILPGETADIELCMKNATADLTCIEAEIQLPEGLSIVRDEEGNPIATLYRNQASRHEFLANVLENGNIKLLVSSISADLFKEGEGPLLSFRIQADRTAPRGECAVETVGESLLVNNLAKAYYCVGITGDILITDDATSLNALNDGHRAMTGDTYDLSGRKTNAHPRKGIFIQNGRKFSVK